MMSDLRELYQEMILDHGRSPRHHHAMPLANRLANGFNQLCGDRLTVYLKTDQDKITAISFQGSGCAISMRVFCGRSNWATMSRPMAMHSSSEDAG